MDSRFSGTVSTRTFQLSWRGTVAFIFVPFAFTAIWGFGFRRDKQLSDEQHAWAGLRMSVFFMATTLGIVGVSAFWPVVFTPFVQWSWGVFSVVFGVGAARLATRDDLNNAGGNRNWFVLLFSPICGALIGWMLLCYFNGALDLRPGQTLQAKVVKTTWRSGKVSTASSLS